MHKKVISGLMVSVLTSSMLFAGGKEGSQPEVEPVAIPDAEEIVVPEVGVGTESDALASSRLFNVGLTAGTLGAGINVATPINENFQVRFNVNGATYDHTATEDDIEYDADLKFVNAGVLVDYFPFESVGFHLTAGAYYNGNEINANASQDDYDIGDETYSRAEVGSLDGKVDFDKFAPYVGLGWGNDSRSEGFGFSLDLGVLVGKTKVSLTPIPGELMDTESSAWQDILTEVEKERSNVQDDLDELKIYPVIMVGITYTF